MRDEADNLRARLLEQEKAVAASTAELNNLVINFASTVDAEKQRLDAAISANNAVFAATQLERTEKFAEADAAREAAAKELIAEVDLVAASHIASLEARLEEATNLVAAVGVTATASGYGTYAQKENTSAVRWAIAAVVSFFIGLGFFSVFLFVEVKSSTLWQTTLTRFGGSLALLSIGAYCGQQSSGHREQARDAKSKQLDLAALRPFIANLDYEEQQAITALAARRLFTEVRPKRVEENKGQVAVTGLAELIDAVKVLQKFIPGVKAD